jgi:hypothetical protein
MKRTLAVMALLGAVGLANAQTIENPILKKLVEKGILKEDEAAAIDEQLAQEEAEKAKYQAEIDKTAMEAKEKLAKLEKQGSMSSLLTGKFKKFEIGGEAYLGYTYQTTKKNIQELTTQAILKQEDFTLIQKLTSQTKTISDLQLIYRQVQTINSKLNTVISTKTFQT